MIENKGGKSGISNESAKASLVIMLFGFAILAFLVLVERPHWFHIRPASGVANAMSMSAEIPAAERSARAPVRTGNF